MACNAASDTAKDPAPAPDRSFEPRPQDDNQHEWSSRTARPSFDVIPAHVALVIPAQAGIQTGAPPVPLDDQLRCW